MCSCPLICVLIGCAAWLGFALMCRAMDRTLSDDPLRNMAWLVVRMYARVVHRLGVSGLEHVPRWRWGDPPAGPMVVVANHTSGADPLLVQAVCGFEIRWLMMRRMMPPALDPLWRWIGVIAVEQNGRDSGALRSAMRHLKAGGVIGIFAEGGLERPAGTVMPFEPGVGLIVQKTGSRVLPVVIDGTPECESAMGSLLRCSRARVRFLPQRSYENSTLGPAGIAEDLEVTIAEALGWPRRGGHQPLAPAAG
jgi:1-acyl-sn-glycerol-3-phosphate acyltransferase